MRVGCDLQSLVELRRKAGLYGNRSVFTAGERAHCEGKPDPWASFGGLLCAKEACIKALSGFEGVPALTFLDLEIEHRPDGRPALRPGARLAGWASELGMHFDVTISHSGDYAMAVVIAARAPPSP
jgi:holo-[acyl-carrier protein] synthase